MSFTVATLISKQRIVPRDHDPSVLILEFMEDAPPFVALGFVPCGTNIKAKTEAELGLTDELKVAMFRAGPNARWIFCHATGTARLTVGEKTLYQCPLPAAFQALVLYPVGTTPPGTRLLTATRVPPGGGQAPGDISTSPGNYQSPGETPSDPGRNK